MGVCRMRRLRSRNKQTPRHSQVHKKLRGLLLTVDFACKLENDSLAHATHSIDTSSRQSLRDQIRRRLEGLRHIARPHGPDRLAMNTRMNTIGDGFNFWEFGHNLFPV